MLKDLRKCFEEYEKHDCTFAPEAVKPKHDNKSKSRFWDEYLLLLALGIITIDIIGLFLLSLSIYLN